MFVNGSREVCHRSIVLVGGEAASDVDAIEQSSTRRDPSERGGCRVTVRIDPDGGAALEQKVIEHEGVQGTDRSAGGARTTLRIDGETLAFDPGRRRSLGLDGDDEGDGHARTADATPEVVA